MTKHTEGPWRAETEFVNHDGRNFPYLSIFGGDGFELARVNGNGKTNSVHNARLIAAAPELEEIVKKLRDWYETAGYTGNGPSGGSLLFDDDSTFGTHIRSVLAKVEGL
jgi:hypothetical protein